MLDATVDQPLNENLEGNNTKDIMFEPMLYLPLSEDCIPDNMEQNYKNHRHLLIEDIGESHLQSCECNEQTEAEIIRSHYSKLMKGNKSELEIAK